MDPKDIDLIIEEFSASNDRWTDLALQGLYRAFDLGVRNGEREFNLFLSMTSLSVAFLTIVMPLLKDSLSVSIALLLAATFSLFTSVIGISILLITIRRDGRIIREDSDWEHKTMRSYLDQCVAIRSSLYDYKSHPDAELWTQINTKTAAYFESRKELNGQAKKRQEDKEKESSAVALKYLRIAFWACVVIAYLLLIYWLVNVAYASLLVAPQLR